MKHVSLVLGVLVLVSSPVFAQTAPSHGWIDVDVMRAQPAQGDQTYSGATPRFREALGFAASYPKMPTALGGGTKGGVQIGPVALGVQYMRTSSTYDAGMAVVVPHPLFFNRSATATASTPLDLERTDHAVDVQVGYLLPTPDALRVRVFGGPTYFRTAQDMVSGIEYAQFFTVFGSNVADITTFDQEAATGSAWGLNVGADAAWFFSRYVGVGGGLSYNSGTVTVTDPLTQTDADLKMGATTLNGGLRLRF